MDLPKVQHRQKSPPPQPSKSVSPGADASACLSPMTACQLNLAQKSPSSNDRASPEPNCSICLGKLVDKSFANGCMHKFCFGCLLQWSKIKPKCPLCNQSFKSIIHNVCSMHKYDEYHLPPPSPTRCHEPSVYQTHQDFLSTIEVHTMAHSQRVPFRYSTTVTGDRRFQAQIYTTVNSGWVLPSSRPPPRSNGRLFGQRRHVASNQFRSLVYEQDMWAQAPSDITGRVRDCSPTFYRNNPAQVHRLVPWLLRELDILLTVRDISVLDLIDLIVKSISRYEIDSSEMRRLLRGHLGERTDHFLHEFHTFARSHFDLVGYDNHVSYGPNPALTVAIQVVSSDSSDDSDVIILPQDHSEPSVAGPSGVNHRRNQRSAAPSPSTLDTDECQFVQYIKPRHERTPEIIDLSSEDERIGDETISIDLGSFGPMEEIQIDELLDYKLEDLDSARLMLENLDSDRCSLSATDASTSSEYLPPKSKSLAQLRLEREESKKVPAKKVKGKCLAKGKSRVKSSKRVVESPDEETKRKKHKPCNRDRREERGKKLVSRKKRVETATKPSVVYSQLSESSDDDAPLLYRSRKPAISRDLSTSDEETPRKTTVRKASQSHRMVSSDDEPVTSRGMTRHATKRYQTKTSSTRPCSAKPSSTTAWVTVDPVYDHSSYQAERKYSDILSPPFSPLHVPRHTPSPSVTSNMYDSCDEGTLPSLSLIGGRRHKPNTAATRELKQASRRCPVSSPDETNTVSSRTRRNSTSVREPRLELPIRNFSDEGLATNKDELSQSAVKTNLDQETRSPVHSIASYITKPSSSGHRPWQNHPEGTTYRSTDIPMNFRSSAHMYASSEDEATLARANLALINDELFSTNPSNGSMLEYFGNTSPLPQSTFTPRDYPDEEATLPLDSYYSNLAHRPDDCVPSTSRVIPSVIVSPIRTKNKDMPKLWSKMSEHASSHSDHSDVPTWSIRNKDARDSFERRGSPAYSEPEEKRPKLKSIVITRTANQYRASEVRKRKHKRKKSKREWKRETRRVSSSGSSPGGAGHTESDDTDSSS